MTAEVATGSSPLKVGQAGYPDRLAAAQVFVRGDACELETLGSLTTLGSGQATAHREGWVLREGSP